MTTQAIPAGWKTYDAFAYGIGTNRLPTTEALAGHAYRLRFEDGRSLDLAFGGSTVAWSDQSGTGTDQAEVILVAPNTYFIDVIFAALSTEAETIILNVTTGRVLSIRSVVREAGAFPGEPQVAQIFRAGFIDDPSVTVSGPVPAPTRDLIGLRAHFTYSPHHVYEHTYLSSERYCWQCLVGVQRGHGDVDLTTTYKFDEDQYIFTFREFKIAVASTFFYNFRDLRSTGKFLGITGAGAIENKPAGAFIRKASLTTYLAGEEPV